MLAGQAGDYSVDLVRMPDELVLPHERVRLRLSAIDNIFIRYTYSADRIDHLPCLRDQHVDLLELQVDLIRCICPLL